MSNRESTFYDGVIIGSLCLPHACTLILHEPIANLSQESEARCRGACRSIITLLRVSGTKREGGTKLIYSNEYSVPMSLHIICLLLSQLCSAHAEAQMASLHIIFIFICGMIGRSLIRQLEALYSNLIAHEFAQSEPNPTWDAKEFTESVSLLQADLEVVL
jgi:hypothetical protein